MYAMTERITARIVTLRHNENMIFSVYPCSSRRDVTRFPSTVSMVKRPAFAACTPIIASMTG